MSGAPSVAPEERAERRQVTVMFSDLVGSTALSARMDPEDLRDVISAYQKCVAETVQRFGGFVAKYMGDGVLIYFGYPQAQEDDAELAVRAGLEVIAAVSALKSPVPLQTRVGIATGMVVVGDLIGSGEAQERGIVGETPNLAARLQGIAEPNMVVIADGTRQLIGDLFELQYLGSKDLKGIAGPVRGWAALRASLVESRFEAMHSSGLTALVGREEELELLLRRWSKAKAGEGQVVLLSGEAGIGKSRLTAALLERLAPEPHTRLRYFCSPQHSDSAFFPIIGQMERAAGFAHDDTVQAKLDKLDAVLAQSFTPPHDATLLAEMLSLPNDGRYPALDLTAQQRRERTLEALTSQLEMLARQNPVLMICEDAHWTDPTSLEVFGRVVDRIKTLPALLIVTFRPDFSALWAGRSHVMSLALNRLGERETAAIIARLVGNKELPADVMAEIVERTDGIPLFVEEMTKAVLEAEGEGEARRTAGAVPSPALAVPASLHASLMARLDRLGSAKEVAQIGAAIGREFSHALLAAVADKPEAELGSALDRLIAAGLLFRQGAPPHATFQFKHALVRDAAYGCLLRSQRQPLHARIATRLEERFFEVVDRQPELLARHWTEAGSLKAAISYWSKAGQKSFAQHSTAEAATQLRKGLALLPCLPESAERSHQELELWTTLGWVLYVSEGEAAPETGAAFIRALTLCDQLGDRSSLGTLLYVLGAHHIARAEYTVARHDAQKLLDLALERGEPALELLGYLNIGRISFFLGAFASSLEHLERALSIRALKRSGYLGVETNALAYSANSLTILGHLDQAVARSDEALLVARLPTSHPYHLALALLLRVGVDSLRGEFQATHERAVELAAVAAEHALPLFASFASLYLARSLLAQGETAEGLARARQAYSASAATASSGLSVRLLVLATCCEGAGEVDQALELLDTALERVNATEERFYEAELHRLKGEWVVAYRRARPADAEDCFQRALAVAREQKAKLWELRAVTSLARLWRNQGKRSEARDLLAPVYGWFTEGFDTLYLKEAKALLDELHA